ncbi:MAG: C45 family peptidase [bacterium]
MDVINLTGGAGERGFQQGALMKERFGEMLKSFFSSELWLDNRPAPLPPVLVKAALGFLGAARIKKTVRRRLPLQAERLSGTALGLGIAERLLWGVHYLEIMLCEAGKSLKAPGGCTQLHVQPGAAADGKPLMGRNYDFPNFLRPYQIVRREFPSERGRLATITVTQAPLVGAHQGINETGLAAAANNARLWKGKDLRAGGVPYLFILQEILETCRTVSEGVELITGFPDRSNAGFFGIMDSTGDSRVVEFTASRAAVREADGAGVIAQTNHFHLLKDANLPDGTYWTVKGMEGLEFATSTTARFEAGNALLHEKAGNINVEALTAMLRDHGGGGEGGDCTICCHGAAGSSLASIIADVSERALWVAEGNPCAAEYAKIGFDERK